MEPNVNRIEIVGEVDDDYQIRIVIGENTFVSEQQCFSKEEVFKTAQAMLKQIFTIWKWTHIGFDGSADNSAPFLIYYRDINWNLKEVSGIQDICEEKG